MIRSLVRTDGSDERTWGLSKIPSKAAYLMIAQLLILMFVVWLKNNFITTRWFLPGENPRAHTWKNVGRWSSSWRLQELLFTTVVGIKSGKRNDDPAVFFFIPSNWRSLLTQPKWKVAFFGIQKKGHKLPGSRNHSYWNNEPTTWRIIAVSK